MRTIAEKPWSYLLLEAEYGWVLTFLIGGPVEVDISVLLTDDEVTRIKGDPSSIEALVRDFSRDRKIFSGREIKPPVWG